MDAVPARADLALWFSRAGQPIDAGERALIMGALTPGAAGRLTVSLSMPSSAGGIVVVTGRDLVRLLREEDADNRWWDAEEDERAHLWEVAAERMTESALEAALAAGVAPVSVAARQAAARLATAGIVTDPSIVARAADAAALALHHSALARLAGAPAAHCFRARHALFAAGRWPLGARDEQYYIV